MRSDGFRNRGRVVGAIQTQAQQLHDFSQVITKRRGQRGIGYRAQGNKGNRASIRHRSVIHQKQTWCPDREVGECREWALEASGPRPDDFKSPSATTRRTRRSRRTFPSFDAALMDCCRSSRRRGRCVVALNALQTNYAAKTRRRELVPLHYSRFRVFAAGSFIGCEWSRNDLLAPPG